MPVMCLQEQARVAVAEDAHYGAFVVLTGGRL